MPTMLDPSIQFLADLGVFDVLIPFMLTFTVLYAVFQKTQVFGKDRFGQPKKNINATVAFIMSMFFVGAAQLLTAATLIAQWSAFALVLMILAFIVAATAGLTKWHATWPKIIAIIVMAIITIAAFGAWNWIPVEWLFVSVLPIVLTFLVVAGFIWWISGPVKAAKRAKAVIAPETKAEKEPERLSNEEIRDLIQKLASSKR